jgi:SAM-dependent methyltransferase
LKYGSKKWDERYSAKEYVYGKEPNLFLKQNINTIPKGKVLCVADGEGRNGVFLATHGFDVTSIDFSPQAIEKIKLLAKENNVFVDTICADLLEYDFDENEYNGIISIFSHFKIDDTKMLFNMYFNALKPGGVFLMEAFAKEQLPLDTGGPKNQNLLYDTEDVKQSFPNGKFELLKKDIVYLHEGNLHDGKAIVVRAIVSKP